MLFESVSDTDLARELEDSVFGPRRARLSEIIARGEESGQIREGTDPAATADLLSGPLVRAMVLGSGGFGQDALRAHVDVILDGIAGRAGTPAGATG